MSVRNLDALFAPARVAVVGEPDNVASRQLLQNLEASVPGTAISMVPLRQGLLPRRVRLEPADLALVLNARAATSRAVRLLVEQGCRAMVWVPNSPVPRRVLGAGRPHTLRVLGARSAGVVRAGGVNASTLAQSPHRGTTALIAQSRTVAAATLDWARGRNVGLSWVAVTGAEDDVDVADLLDYAALDPTTRAVILQVGNIRGARKFMSAARAAARGKPVVVLQSHVGRSGHGRDPVRSAAFQRAGMVECLSIGGLFDALAALERLPDLRSGRVLVVGNGAGVCALGTDAVWDEGLLPGSLTPELTKRLGRLATRVRILPGAVDVGAADDAHTVAVLQAVLEDHAIDCVLLIRSPTPEQPHMPLVERLARAGLDNRLATVWLGLETAVAARKRCGELQIATFPSADEAVRALRYRFEYRGTQQMLMQTPPADEFAASHVATVTATLRRTAGRRPPLLQGQDAARLLVHYGFCGSAATATGPEWRVRAQRHPELGMYMSVSAVVAGLAVPCAYGFPPLDGLLARRMLADAGLAEDEVDGGAALGLSLGLTRLGQLIADQPQLAALDMRMCAAADPCALPDARLEAVSKPWPERERLALSPYPSELAHVAALRAATFRIRAIRPSDEPALLRMLASLSLEEVRLRFFRYIREFTHDMAARLTQIDYDREMTLVAAPLDDPDEAVVATATLVADPDGHAAEFAVLVHHDFARNGLGRHLLTCLLRYAATRGIALVHGEVLAENDAMLALARRLGFTELVSPSDPGCYRVEIDPAACRLE